MQKKLFLISIIVGAIIVGVVALLRPVRQEMNSTNDTNQPLHIAASIYPLAHIVEKVAGPLATVQLITPGGVEPHEYEPTPADIASLYQSQGVIINGGGLDAWGEKIAPDLKIKNVRVLVMTEAMTQNVIGLEEINTKGELSKGLDPHMWLDPVLYAQEVESIANFLSSLDPLHTDDYLRNASLYQKELAKLDADYRAGLKNCTFHDIIVSHDAFTYLGSKYTITMNAITGISPEEEPSAARLIDLTKLIREKKINTVFFETLVSPKLAETLSKESGASIAVLNPIEGLTPEDVQNKKNYDILMRENLAALQKALLCQ